MKNFCSAYYSLFIVVSILTLYPSKSFSQNESVGLTWPEGLGFANRLEYSYNVDEEREILENWLNLDYSLGMFSTGLRLDVFQPNDPDPSISRGKEKYAGVDFLYFKADIGESEEGLAITGGNFYSLFGRGMVLKVTRIAR